MYKGKIIFLICLLFLSAYLSGQPYLFPYCYKFPPSERIFEDIYVGHLVLSNEYIANGDTEGLKYCIDVLTDIGLFRSPVEEGHLENRKGILKFYQNNSTEALRHYLEALDIFSRENYTLGTNLILNNISIIFSLVHDNESAKKYLEKAIEHTLYDEINYMSVFKINLIEFDLDLGNFDEALSMALDLYNNYDSTEFRYSDVAIIGLIVNAYNKMGRYEDAAEWVNLGMEKVNDNIDYIDQITFYPYVIEYYYISGDYRKVIDLSGKILPVPNNSFNEDVYETLGILSDACARFGLYEKAWEYEEKAMAIEYSREAVDRELLISVLMIEYATERETMERLAIENEIAINNEKEKAQKKLLFILVFATIVIIVFLVILFRVRKIRKDFRKQLTDENDKLAQINRELDRSNREHEKENNLLDTLISVFAHDLINPFQAILGFSNLIITENDNLKDKEIAEYSSILADTAFQLNQLLVNLKSMAVVQDKTRPLESTRFNVNPVISEVVLLFAPVALKKKIKFKVDNKYDFNAFMNPEIFQSIIRNVVSNAVKFNNRGKEISIGVNNDEGLTRVAVTDQGIGMPEDIRSKLMNGEFLTSRPGTTSEWGSGLGLSICFELIAIYGGRIDIESKEGYGTTVTIIVPDNNETIPED